MSGPCRLNSGKNAAHSPPFSPSKEGVFLWESMTYNYFSFS
jgi:hypothetical protein